MFIDKPKNNRIVRRLYSFFFLFQVAIVIISDQIEFMDVSVTQWIGNFLGLAVFSFILLSHYHYIDKNTFIICIISIIASILTLLFYGEHLFDSLKSLGININSVAMILYLMVLGASHYIKISLEDIQKILQRIFRVSAIVALVTLVIEADKFALFTGRINAYMIDFSGFFPNKNSLGNFSALGLMIGVYVLHISEKKLLNIVSCAVLCLVMVCTLSRAAILSFLVFAVVFFGKRIYAERYKNEAARLKLSGKNIRRLVIIVAVACLVIYVNSEAIQQFVATKLIRSTAGTAGRDEIWKRIVSVFDSTPFFYLFGMGFSELNFRSPNDCHNIFLYLFATGGICKLAIYFFLFKKAWGSIRCMNEMVLADLCISVFIAYLVLGMFETFILFELGLVNFEYALLIFLIPSMNLVENSNEFYEKN